MALDIKQGKQIRPQKVVIYGAEGIGKSTLASQFPDPLFLDLEGGTSQLDVKRIDSIENWADIGTILRELIDNPGLCKTLVIDTADAAEALAMRYICAEKNVKGIEDIGYGKGYQYLAEKMQSLLSTLNIFIKYGYNVVILAHAQMRKFEQPDELGAYDRWELKLQKKVAPLFKEWADMLLFCNYKTTVAVDQQTRRAKASGGKRVIYASHHACWDAKNRHGLPDEFEMDYEIIKPIFEEGNENELVEGRN